MTHTGVKKFIKNIKRRKSVSHLNVYSSRKGTWDYYYSIHGYYYGIWFHLYFNSYNGKEKTEYSSAMKNIEKFKKAFNL